MRAIDEVTVIEVCIVRIYKNRKTYIVSINRYTLIVPGSEWANNVIWIIRFTRTKRYIFTVDESFCCEAFIGIFASMQKITCTRFTIDIVSITIDGIFHKSFDSISYWYLDFFRWFLIFFDSFFICFFWEWFVEEIIGFISEIYAAKTIVTTTTVETE
jgi:hypothetical protein